jgi:transposase-like protein
MSVNAMLGPHTFRKPVAVSGARIELAVVHTIADVARGLGLGTETLRKWVGLWEPGKR